MSATEATAEIFVTALKSLKPRQREAVLEKMLADKDLSTNIGTVVLGLHRQRSVRWTKSFRSSRATDELASLRLVKNDFDAKDWQW